MLPLPAVLVLSLALSPALAGKRKREAASQLPSPTLPSATVSPHALARPALEGAGSQLALEGLKRQVVRFHVQADLTALGGATAEEAAAVFDQLAADPRWRVSRLGETRVATLRRGEPPDVPEHGYHMGEACSRVALVEGPHHSPDWDSPVVGVAEPRAGKIALGTFHPSEGSCRARATALRVPAAISLEVLDASPQGDIPVIGEALARVPAEILSARMSTARIASHGYGLGLPPGEPSADEPMLSVERLAIGGTLRARVNPGEVGWSWLVIRSAGQLWESEAIGTATLEQPGWSAEPADAFLVQVTFGSPPIPAGATAELWFQGAGEPRLLVSGVVR